MDLSVPFLGNPNITRQGARANASVPKISDYQSVHNPLTAFLAGLGGARPDELSGSVLDGSRQANADAAEPGFAIGTALNTVPLIGGVMKGLNALGIGGKTAMSVPRLSSQLGAVGDLKPPRLSVSGEPTLQELLLKEPYTMKSIEALPDTSRVPRQAILEQSQRKDLSVPELQTLKSMLLDSEGQKHVSADRLLFSLADKTVGKYQLTREPTEHYADYGLDRLGINNVTKLNSSTNKYNFDNNHGIDTNHFSDPHNFGHTRTFDEDGVRHVVEVQSDYAQLKPAERSFMNAEDVQKLADDPRVASNEFERKVGESRQREFAAPLTKIATRRLADEEIANALRNPPELAPKINPEYSAVKKQYTESLTEASFRNNLYQEERQAYGPNHVNSVRARSEFLAAMDEHNRLDELVKNTPTHLESLPMPPKLIRFATPDTVAKVEGWSRDTTHAVNREIAETNLANWKASEPGADRNFYIAHYQKELETMPPASPQPVFENSGHQSLYRKYEKELVPHLEKLGGKPYTDPKGNTWIEVPIKDNSGRVQLFSVGAGGALIAGQVLSSSPSESAQ